MQNIFSQYGSSAQAPAQSVKTIIRVAHAATKKEQKPHKILARWFKTLKIPVRLYT